MELAGVDPDTAVLCAAISACEREGQWEVALATFASMESMGVAVNNIACGAAISACEKGQEPCHGVLAAYIE